MKAHFKLWILTVSIPYPALLSVCRLDGNISFGLG